MTLGIHGVRLRVYGLRTCRLCFLPMQDICRLISGYSIMDGETLAIVNVPFPVSLMLWLFIGVV